jgi:hypothetical protein
MLMREIVTMISAPPRQAKSMIAETVSLHLACGKSFGRFIVDKPYRVLYFCMEDPNKITGPRMDQLMRGMKMKPERGMLRFWKGHPKILTHEGYAAVINRINCLKPDVVVFDTLSHLHAVQENDNTEMTTLMECINDLANELNVAILLVHHHRKSSGKDGDTGTGMDKTRGAGAIGANSPISISGKKSRFVFDTKFKKPDDFAVYVEGGKTPEGDKTLQVIFHHPDETVEARQQQSAVLDAIKALLLKPEHVTNKSLEMYLDVSANTLKERLQPLLSSGVVEKFRVEHGAFAYKLSNIHKNESGHQNMTFDDH